MEETTKVFNTAEIIILVMLAVANDGFEVAGDIALVLPGLGEVIAGFIELLNFIIWGVILFWFIMKEGISAGPLGLQAAGGIAEFMGFPARTLTVILGIYLANHPKVAGIAGGINPASATSALGGAVSKVSTLEERAAVIAERTSQRVVSTPEIARAQSATFAPPLIYNNAHEGETEQGVSERAFGMPAEPIEQVEEDLFDNVPLAV